MSPLLIVGYDFLYSTVKVLNIIGKCLVFNRFLNFVSIRKFIWDFYFMFIMLFCLALESYLGLEFDLEEFAG